MKRPTVSREAASHPYARIIGAKEGDDVIATAEKAVAAMKAAGLSPRTIRKAEQMLEEAKRRVGDI